MTVAVIGGEQSAKAMKILMEKGVPAYEVPDKAVDAMAALNEYAKIQAMIRGSEPPKPDPVAETAARGIIRSARAAGRTALTEVEAKHVFAAYGLPVTKTTLALTEDEAVEMAEAAGLSRGPEDRFAGYPAQIRRRRSQSQHQGQGRSQGRVPGDHAERPRLQGRRGDPGRRRPGDGPSRAGDHPRVRQRLELRARRSCSGWAGSWSRS